LTIDGTSDWNIKIEMTGQRPDSVVRLIRNRSASPVFTVFSISETGQRPRFLAQPAPADWNDRDGWTQLFDGTGWRLRHTDFQVKFNVSARLQILDQSFLAQNLAGGQVGSAGFKPADIIACAHHLPLGQCGKFG
jgi:hypothetical protein